MINEYQILDLSSKLLTTKNLLGDYHGHNSIVTKDLDERIKLYSYILYYEKHPLRFNFIFYSPNVKWKLQHFSYDDQIFNELLESLKIYRQLDVIKDK